MGQTAKLFNDALLMLNQVHPGKGSLSVAPQSDERF